MKVDRERFANMAIWHISWEYVRINMEEIRKSTECLNKIRR